jgi:hypothetical protein
MFLFKRVPFPKIKTLLIFAAGYGLYNREALLVKFSDKFKFINENYFDKTSDQGRIIGNDLYDYFQKFAIPSNETIPPTNQDIFHEELKLFKEKKELKINSISELIQKCEENIIELSKKKTDDKNELKSLLEEEKLLMQEINAIKQELNDKISELEEKGRNLNTERITLIQQIQKEAESYSTLYQNTIERLETHYGNEIKNMREKYLSDIKTFHLDFNKLEKDEVGKRELLKNLSDLTKIRKDFKQKEIDFISGKIGKEFPNLVGIYDKLKKLNETYKNVANEYQKVKKEQYDNLNKIFSIEKVIENFSIMKNEKIEKKEHEHKLKVSDHQPNY